MPSGLAGRPETPSILGCDGPYTSASSRPTRRPCCANAQARFAATVDFPTPPLPEAIATIRSTPGIFSGPLGWAGRCGLRSGGGAVSVCPVITIETVPMPSSAFSAASALTFASSYGFACDGGISMTNRTAPSSPTFNARTTPDAMMSPPATGSSICLSAAVTVSRSKATRLILRLKLCR